MSFCWFEFESTLSACIVVPSDPSVGQSFEWPVELTQARPFDFQSSNNLAHDAMPLRFLSGDEEGMELFGFEDVTSPRRGRSKSSTNDVVDSGEADDSSMLSLGRLRAPEKPEEDKEMHNDALYSDSRNCTPGAKEICTPQAKQIWLESTYSGSEAPDQWGEALESFRESSDNEKDSVDPQAPSAEKADNTLEIENSMTWSVGLEQLGDRPKGFLPGATVELQNLRSAPHLNGVLGICESWDHANGKVIVLLGMDRSRKLVKVANVSVVDLPVDARGDQGSSNPIQKSPPACSELQYLTDLLQNKAQERRGHALSNTWFCGTGRRANPKWPSGRVRRERRSDNGSSSDQRQDHQSMKVDRAIEGSIWRRRFLDTINGLAEVDRAIEDEQLTDLVAGA